MDYVLQNVNLIISLFSRPTFGLKFSEEDGTWRFKLHKLHESGVIVVE